MNLIIKSLKFRDYYIPIKFIYSNDDFILEYIAVVVVYTIATVTYRTAADVDVAVRKDSNFIVAVITPKDNNFRYFIGARETIVIKFVRFGINLNFNFNCLLYFNYIFCYLFNQHKVI